MPICWETHMRSRLTVVFAAALAASTGACAGTPSATTPDRSPAAPAVSAADNNLAVCEGVYTFAMAKADENDPIVAAFLDLLINTAKPPTDRQIAIRHAFYTKQVNAVQPLATEATDPNLHAALQAYADGWADLAAVQSAAGPETIQPNWQPVLDLCPGIQDRIYADLDARGQ
jgi:hypothetical protein